MLRIDTGQARTDLYGIGKGGAQVLDNSEIVNLGREERARQERANTNEQARQDDLISKITKLSGGDIRPADKAYFYGKQNEVYNKAVEKFKKGSLSMEDQLELQNDIAMVNQEALISKDRREQLEAMHKEAYAHPEKYVYQDEIDNIQNQLYDLKHGGQLNEDMPTLTPYESFDEYVNSKLVPTAKKLAENKSNRGYQDFNITQAEDMVVSSLVDPIKMRSVQRDYDALPENQRLGTKNAVEWAKKKYAPTLTVDVNPQLSEWQVYGQGGNKSDNKTVSSTFTKRGEDDWDLTLEYVKPPDNPYLAVENPDNPKESIDVKPLRYVRKGSSGYIEAAKKPKTEGATPEIVKISDSKGSFKMLHDKFGINNVFDVVKNNNVPEHIDLKYGNVPKEEVKQTTPSTNNWSKYKRQ